MLDDLLLLRLRAVPDPARGETRSHIAPDLQRIAADPASGQGEWRAAFSAAVHRQSEAGHLVAGGRQGARLRLTDTGHQRVQAVFHLPAHEAPAGPGQGKRAPGWTWWRDRYALPIALDGQAADADADSLRIALLRRLYLPDLSAGGRQSSLKQTVDLLLAKQLGMTRVGPGALREAALRGWVRRGPPPPIGHAAPAPHIVPAPAPDAAAASGTLAGEPALFAAHTLAAARRSRTGRFSDNKVFLSHVWRELLAAGQAAPGELAAFKERLLRANAGGRLRLSRADLAGAHDPADVRDSAVGYLGETFHFVRLD